MIKTNYYCKSGLNGNKHMIKYKIVKKNLHEAV